MQIIVEETIRAPRTITFANAADVLNWPSMISAIQSTEILTREPIVAGTRFRETRKMYGQVSSEEMTFTAVSYTHLRAHETVLDLVCRLLLEKKNNLYLLQLHAQ